MVNLDKSIKRELTRRGLFKGAIASVVLPPISKLENALNAFAVIPHLKDRRYTKDGVYAPDGSYIPYEVPKLLPNEPMYLPWSKGPGDFIAHARDEDNLGGIDLIFGHGVPVISPSAGSVFDVWWDRGTGWNILIDYGIVQLYFAHLKKPFIKKGDVVKRGQIIGREGNSGENARDPHTHFSVAGHEEFKKILNSRDYKDYGRRFRGDLARLNLVVNPDRLTGSNVILYQNTWDYEKNHDELYLDALRKANDSIGVREAINKLQLTSFYIDHQNPEVILKAMNSNPRYKALILAYYERFLPKGEALDDLLQRMNLPKDFLDYRKTPSGLLVPPQYTEANGALTRR